MKKKLSLLNYGLFLTICSIIFLQSCKKDYPTDAEVIAKGTITFNIAGVQVSEESLGKSASINMLENTSQASYLETKVENVSFGTTIETQNIITNIREIQDPRAFGNKLASTTKKMSEGIKYILILVNASNNEIEQIKQATVGTKLTCEIKYNQIYNWYAYSYNTSDDIPLPSAENMSIETPTDKVLLYASGTVSTNDEAEKPLDITFAHKLAEIKFELDTDRLFGTISNSDISLEFVDNFLNKGTFSILTGQISNITSYSKPITLSIDTSKRNVSNAKFYIADPSNVTSFSIRVKSMKVTYLNNTEAILVQPGNPRVASFTGFQPAIGKSLVGKLKLWYIFPQRQILHVTRTGAEGYGYAAQPYSANGTTLNPTLNKASYNLLSDPNNYSNNAGSIVRSGGFTHTRCFVDGTLHTFLASKPDITIISVYYLMSAQDIDALISYIDQGGVVLLMTDGVNPNDREAQQPFFRKLFDTPTITLQNNGYSSGALYKMANINDEILNGPFGDIRRKYWGEDASATTSLSNVPTSQITQYSEAKAANGIVPANGITMFKHKYKNFFWIGDGGFLSNEFARGIYNSFTIEPFATVSLPANPNTMDNTRNYNNYPIPKLYGYNGNGIGLGVTYVWNSVVFANIMSWGIVNAEFNGINTGGLRNNQVQVNEREVEDIKNSTSF